MSGLCAPHAFGVSIGQQGCSVPTGPPMMGPQMDVPHATVPGGVVPPPEPPAPPIPVPPVPPVVPAAPPVSPPPVDPPVGSVPPPPVDPPVAPEPPPPVDPPVAPVPPVVPVPPVDPAVPPLPALPPVWAEPPDPPVSALSDAVRRPPQPTPSVLPTSRAAVSAANVPVFCFIGLSSIEFERATGVKSQHRWMPFRRIASTLTWDDTSAIISRAETPTFEARWSVGVTSRAHGRVRTRPGERERLATALGFDWACHGRHQPRNCWLGDALERIVVASGISRSRGSTKNGRGAYSRAKGNSCRSA